MSCEQAVREMAGGRPLTGDAVEHLRRCPACAALQAMEFGPGEAAAAQAGERVISALTRDLDPVRPLAPWWFYACAIAAAGAAVAAAGIGLLGTAGWRLDSVTQRAYFSACLVGVMGASATLAARLMAPGMAIPVTVKSLVLASSALLGIGALLYPPAMYEHFSRAAATCLSIGLLHAVGLAGAAWWILRRGAPGPGNLLPLAVGLSGGLTGALVLFSFCPHRDLGHIALAHGSVPAIAACLAALLARRRER